MSDTPRYDALLKEANTETARFCATDGTLRVWDALEAVERENAELLAALKGLLEDRSRMAGIAMHSNAEVRAMAAVRKAEGK